VKLLVVVASVGGRTRRMAEALADGAREAGAKVLLRAPEETQDADLLEADAIALGSPVHMGGVASSMVSLFERTAPLWIAGRLRGKLGAAFVSSGDGERGGGELTLLALLAWLAENGILLVPVHNREPGYRDAGCHWGPLARTNPKGGEPGPTEAQLEVCRSHGRQLAECTQRWLAGGTARRD
jgi:NAD(P)H dehydrogenase (quinone)